MSDLEDRGPVTPPAPARRRWFIAGAAAVALALAAAAVIAWPRAGSQSTAGSTSTTSPSAAPGQSPSPMPSPTAAGHPAPVLGGWVSSSAPSLPGTAIWIGFQPEAAASGPGQTTVNVLAKGTLRTAKISGEWYQDDCPFMTAALSPDGRLVAMVLGSTHTGTGGDEVYVVPLDGGPAKLVGRGAVCDREQLPVWLADSRSLRVVNREGPGTVDVTTGAFTARAELSGAVAFSPDGAFRARSVTGPWFDVETMAGVGIRHVNNGGGADEAGPRVQALSVGGHYAAVGGPRVGPTVIDTTTGKVVTASTLFGQAGLAQRNVVFLAGGGLVVQAASVQGDSRWYLLSGIGAVTATLNPAPASFLIGQFAYTP